MAGAKTALITGITGQDGSILAGFLLEKGYRVTGLQQWSATDNTQNLADLCGHSRFSLRFGDMSDGGCLMRAVDETGPDEIYNLAAMSHVGVSFDLPELTADVNALGTLRLLEAVRLGGRAENCRFYQASSSELFGNAPAPQSETTPFQPCSPYGTAKLYAYWITVNYRQAYGMHASNGILFNHESPVRGEHFVTRKITLAVAAIVAGRQDRLLLGNLDAKRDWGHAADYADGMWCILQQDRPDDYVLATGESHSVREFVTESFRVAGIELDWRGSGVSEEGVDARTGRVLVAIDASLYRPVELSSLCGDPAKAARMLSWRHQTTFRQIVEEMTLTDLKNNKRSKDTGESFVVWGSGTPRREFMYVDDLADALVFLLKHYSSEKPINVGCGRDISVLELAQKVADVVGYEGTLTFDATKPDGVPRKIMDSSRLFAMGWRPRIALESGLAETYAWYRTFHDHQSVAA